MTTRFKKKLLLLGTIILMLESVFVPIGIVHAETTLSEEKQEQVERPSMKTYLDAELASDPFFFFPNSRLQGTAEEPLEVTLLSDQKVTEVQVFLPEEATLLKEQLPTGISIEQGNQPLEWMIQSERAQNTFVLPLVFDSIGSYEVSVENSLTIIDIQAPENKIADKKTVKKIETFDESSERQRNLQKPPANNPHIEMDMEKSKETIFQGETVEVNSFEQLRVAVTNPDVSKIEVKSDLSRSSTSAETSIGNLNRSLVIKGNGHTIDFGGGNTSSLDNGSLFLSELGVNQKATLRIEDALLKKSMPIPIFNAISSGLGWELQLKNIAEHENNVGSLAYIPQGKVAFIGGANKSILPNLNVNRNFIEAKETVVNGKATLDVKRGNTCVIWSSNLVNDPKITIEEGARVNIITGEGSINAIDLAGSNPIIKISDSSQLNLQTYGSSDNPLNHSNNSIILRGRNPKLIVENKSEINVQSTSAKRGIVLSGPTPKVVVSDSTLTVINDSNAVLLYGEDTNLNISKSTINVSTTIGAGITLSGNSPSFKVSDSNMTIQSTTGQRLNLVGSNSTLDMNNSKLTMNSSTGRGIYLQGVKPQILLTGSQIVQTDTGDTNGVIIEGDDALLSLINKSEVSIVGSGNGITENIQIGNNNARPELSIKDSSKVSVTTTSSTEPAKDIEQNAIHLKGEAPKLSVTNNSEIEIQIIAGERRGILLSGDNGEALFRNSVMRNHTINGDNIRLNGNSSSIIVSQKSELDLRGGNGNNIAIYGDFANLLVNGESSIQAVSSGTKQVSTSMEAMIFLGENHQVNLVNQANIKIDNSDVTLTGNIGTGLGLYSNSSKIDLTNDAKLNLSTESNGINGAVRLIEHGNAIIRLNSSKMNIIQRGSASAIRVDRQNNKFILENNSELFAQNLHTNSYTDGTSNLGNGFGQQAILFPEDRSAKESWVNEFSVTEGSILQLSSLQGPALDFDGTYGRFDVISKGQLRIEGSPKTESAGIIQSRKKLDIDFDNPLFLDLRNNRAQGNIFTVPEDSLLNAINSDLTVWKKGSNLDGDPDLNFPTLDFSFTGKNFNTLGESSQPNVLNTDTFGNTGLTTYSRISSNNARWAIADELRVPTNADKKIHGHVSIPVGLEDTRPAWTNEAVVTVEVESPSGEDIQEYTAKTVGDTREVPGISIYGEEPRGGLFEIDLQEPLEPGAKVRISRVRLMSEELTDGFEHLILTDTVKVFPIIPPSPAQFTSTKIAQNTTELKGVTDNNKSKVTATHNGEPLNTENVTVDNEGRFTLDLRDVTLEMNDEIQVFLRDSEGSAQEAGLISPPETNNGFGNINPPTELIFHDVTFEPATILIVDDIGPISPIDPLDPEVEVNPENKPEFPTDQGKLSIDFVSSFNFGSQAISAHEKNYHAQPQRLLNEDGTVNESEERPNYVQISDRRPESERNGWELAVTQKEQFKGEGNQELIGATLGLSNQQTITSQGGIEPGLQSTPCNLVPKNRRILLKAQGSEGMDTWIYRFGDAQTAGESVTLNVPKGANPESTTYKTTLIWELSAVPSN
ncbi:WxL domain-containing protein [Enterococcus casseliflavus]|uniref:WxL domain-containing protein n=1 Tax=Enterococcus casseliflavus TaxID=37734 RepID=UPI002542F9B5|nr:WxL domain-containing protein [Enterococcus casseliflavus]MDK4450924.1 WxL domain-containing protein [Enterococcus casseliflavus]